MFRKKNLGTVTVMEDEPEDFDDLGLSSVAAAQEHDPEALDHMSAQQLEQLALGSANAGKDATSRALRMANEAREIGTTTAETMHKQTEQLEKMSEDIEVVHDYLDKSERIIDKMTKPKLVRMFQKKKAGGKGLDKVKRSGKDIEAREDTRRAGVQALDLGSMTGGQGQMSMEELNREELLEDAKPSDSSSGWRVRKGRKGKEAAAPKEVRAIREDYSQYSEGVADVLRKQDGDLDQISDALSDMKALAGAMNNELDYQDKLIGEVQDFTVETAQRTKDNARRINKIK